MIYVKTMGYFLFLPMVSVYQPASDLGRPMGRPHKKEAKGPKKDLLEVCHKSNHSHRDAC